MGKCIYCGVKYCDCNTDGVCGNCAIGVNSGVTLTNEQIMNSASYQNNVSICGRTLDDLQRLKNKMDCAVASAAFVQLGFDTAKINTIQSYILSAWNYRSDPCLFNRQLSEVESAVQLLEVKPTMRELNNGGVVFQQLDLAIARAGLLTFYNLSFGTTHQVDRLYVTRLIRAERMLSNCFDTKAEDFSKSLLTNKR
jgi:hypothetical protein